MLVLISGKTNFLLMKILLHLCVLALKYYSSYACAHHTYDIPCNVNKRKYRLVLFVQCLLVWFVHTIHIKRYFISTWKENVASWGSYSTYARKKIAIVRWYYRRGVAVIFFRFLWFPHNLNTVMKKIGEENAVFIWINKVYHNDEKITATSNLLYFYF